MARRLALLLLPLALAACGADGPPVAPSVAAQQGLSVSGETEVGVAGRL